MPPWSRMPRRPVVPWRALAEHLVFGLVAGVAVMLVLTWANTSWRSAALVGLAVMAAVTVAASVAGSVPGPPPGPADRTGRTDPTNRDDPHPPEP
ncbi:hypothetical protein [Cellulomonas hominis]